jgi:hypothetical protein
MSVVSVTSHDPADVRVATDYVQSSTHREMGVKYMKSSPHNVHTPCMPLSLEGEPVTKSYFKTDRCVVG